MKTPTRPSGKNLAQQLGKLKGIKDMNQTQIDRLVSKFEVQDGCWEWRGSKSPTGYGKLSLWDWARYAHRVVYELLRGPIQDGLEIDHLCRNRGCVNPDHLEPVTKVENLRRGVGAGGLNARKMFCPKGHNYKTINDRGWRRCGTCNADWMRTIYKNRNRKPS